MTYGKKLTSKSANFQIVFLKMFVLLELGIT